MESIVLVTGASLGNRPGHRPGTGAEGRCVCVNTSTMPKPPRGRPPAPGPGRRAMAVQADVADRAAVEQMIHTVEDAWGPVDLLVNNAGISLQGLFQDTTDEQWDRILGVNLTGPRNTIQAVLPAMISAKRGCIVNISSIWGLRGASCEVAYACTKAAIVGMTRSLALELAPSGIRVNAVAPGCIETDMVRVLSPETRAMLVEETPLGRLGTPEDIAHAVAFLASEKASFLTGQILTADGGFIG